MTTEKGEDVSTIIPTIATNEEFISQGRLTTNQSKPPSHDAKPKVIQSFRTRSISRFKQANKENRSHFKVQTPKKTFFEKSEEKIVLKLGSSNFGKILETPSSTSVLKLNFITDKKFKFRSRSQSNRKKSILYGS